jgi:hypothetical protein
LAAPVPADSAGILTVSVPAARIAAGDHLVILQGRVREGNLEDVSSYYFQLFLTD